MKRRQLTPIEIEESANLKRLWEEKKKERKKNGIKFTQEIAAEEMGFNTQAAVSHYLSGKIPLNTDAILLFSKFLDCKPTEIRASLNIIESDHIDSASNRSGMSESNDLSSLISVSSPRTQAILETLNKADREGRLTEDDLKLIDAIAQRLVNDKNRKNR